MRKTIDVSGVKFGRLTAIKYVSNGKWSCDCSCGFVGKIVKTGSLRNGGVKSCGCLRVDRAIAQSKTNTKHGLCNTAEYSSWEHIKARCYDKKNRNYHNYGARGIGVCESWANSFLNFLSDMGCKPSQKHEIERINNNGDYEPGNCRWATRTDQMNNTRRCRFVTWNGKTQTVMQWAKECKVPYHYIYNPIIRKKLDPGSVIAGYI